MITPICFFSYSPGRGRPMSTKNELSQLRFLQKLDRFEISEVENEIQVSDFTTFVKVKFLPWFSFLTITFYFQEYAAPESEFWLSFNQAFDYSIPQLEEAVTILMETWEPMNEKPGDIEISIS